MKFPTFYLVFILVQVSVTNCAVNPVHSHAAHQDFTDDHDPQEQPHLGQVKLGLAAAFFFSVLLACGLPIVVINCVQKTGVDRSRNPVLSAHSDLQSDACGGSLVTHCNPAFVTPKHSVNSTTSGPVSDWGREHSPPRVARISVDSEPLGSPTTPGALTETTDLLTGRPVDTSWPHSRRMLNMVDGHRKRGKSPTLCLRTAHSTKRPVDRKVLLRVWFSRCNCFAAGIFLSSGFMELYVDVEEAIGEAKHRLNVTTHFPFAPFLTLLGFFLVLSIEQFVWTARAYRLRYRDRLRFSAPDTPCITPLSPASAEPSQSSSQPRFSFAAGSMVATSHRDTMAHSGHSHLPSVDDFDSFESVLRVIVLLCAMSVHSMFEGLAVGLQPTVAQTLALFSAILLHKLIISAGIGMNLATMVIPPSPSMSQQCDGLDPGEEQNDNNENPTTVGHSSHVTVGRKIFYCQALSTLILAIASPLGVLIGWALMQQQQSAVLLMTTAVLQGVACGTFFYVVFCELLPEEFRGPVGDRLGKLLFLILGFSLVCIYSLFMPH